MPFASEAPRIYVTVTPPKNAGTGVVDLALKVLSLEYEDAEAKTDKVTLTLDNSDLSYFDHPIMEQGTRVTVSWGYVGRMSPPRACIVQKITGSLQLKVEAQDAGVLMQKVTRTRTYENTTRSELVHALAKENGFGDAQRFIEETDRIIPVQSQAGMTDYAFMKRLAQLEGFEFFVDFDGLHWHPRRLGQRPTRVLTYYLPTPTMGDILSFNVENDVTQKPGASVVKARDPLEKKDTTAKADDATTKRDTLGGIAALLGVEPPDGSANAKKTEAVPLPGETLVIDLASGVEKTVVKPQGAASGDVKNTSDAKNATAEAKAQFTKAQQAAVQMTLKMSGDPSFVAKTVVELNGLGQRLSGKYYVTEVKHKVDSQAGYEMDVKMRTDGGNKGDPEAKKDSKAEQNKKDAPKDAASDLTETQVFDGRTGETKTIYKDTRGRENAGK